MTMTTGFDAGPPLQRRHLHDDRVARQRHEGSRAERVERRGPVGNRLR
jgi:hypothetical protein